MKNTNCFLLTVATTAILLVPGLKAEDEKPIEGTIAVEKGVPEHKLASQAKVTLAEALKTAAAEQKGPAIKAELENEKGFLIWTVEFTEGDEVIEVTIDAGSGKILATEKDTPKEEKSDKEEEKDKD